MQPQAKTAKVASPIIVFVVLDVVIGFCPQDLVLPSGMSRMDGFDSLT